MNTNPSDRAMKCAVELTRGDKIYIHGEGWCDTEDIARIIDRHFSATPLNTTSETTTKRNTNLTKGRDENE
jgi:hypothetical protein